MQEILDPLRDHWLAYIGLLLLGSFTLWLLVHKWFWDNIFGVALLGSLARPPFEIDFYEIHIEAGDGPHWMVPVTLAVLHFLTVNYLHSRRAEDAKIAELETARRADVARIEELRERIRVQEALRKSS